MRQKTTICRRIQYPLGFIILLLVSACSGQSGRSSTEPLVIFAAASLTDAFTEIGHQFEQDHPGQTVVFNFAGSQQLAHQLSQGAPADVFASADESQMAAVIELEQMEGNPALIVRIFARNRLVIGLPPGNKAGLREVADLARPGTRILLAVPEVPAGRYAHLFLQKAADDPSLGPAFRQSVLNNVVSYEQNVRAVLSKILLSEADAGLIYQSDLHGLEAPAFILIPDRLNVMATYPIAPLVRSSQPDAAMTFVDFVLSPAGQEILARHGFLSGEADSPAGSASFAARSGL